jgi:hemoglobin-like flavoprotein
MKKEIEHIKVGELEIPVDYWSIDKEQKEDLFNAIMDSMLRILDRNMNKNIDRVQLLNRILESSIMVNLQEEQYEIVDVMTNIKKLLNEQGI